MTTLTRDAHVIDHVKILNDQCHKLDIPYLANIRSTEDWGNPFSFRLVFALNFPWKSGLTELVYVVNHRETKVLHDAVQNIRQQVCAMIAEYYAQGQASKTRYARTRKPPVEKRTFHLENV